MICISRILVAFPPPPVPMVSFSNSNTGKLGGTRLAIATPTMYHHTLILYSWKVWWQTKFGGLAVYITTTKLKSAKISSLHIIRMGILYQTAKFKSANIILAIAILGSTAKFNSHQYFQL